MDRRSILSAVIMLAALPLIIGTIAVVLLWCLHQWNTPIWQLAVAGFVLFCGSSYIVWRIARKLASGRLAFSTRAMLIGVGVIAVLLSTVGRWFLGTYRQHQAVRTVGAHGGAVLHYEIRASDSRSWLYRWLGWDPFAGVQGLNVDTDRALSALIDRSKNFDDIEVLSFGSGVTAAGYELVGHLNKFPRLRIGEWIKEPIDNRVLQQLQKWTGVQYLFFNGCPNVTDAGLEHLIDLPNLERLALVEEGGGMVITDAGLQHVGRMKNLKFLMLLGQPQVTDVGLALLHQLTRLENIVIRKTGVTPEGLTQFYQALPDCRVYTDVFVPGHGEVKRIVVWRIGRPDVQFSVIADAETISQIRRLIETCREQPQIDDRDLFDPRPAKYRLEFMGLTRVLYEVRLGNGEFQQTTIWNQWTKWQIGKDLETKLSQLILPQQPQP